MSSWKDGTLVLCIDDRKLPDFNGDRPYQGRVYTVSKTIICPCLIHRVCLRGVKISEWACNTCGERFFGPLGWFKNRFIKVGELKPGLGIISYEDNSIESSNS